jgi:voltage-gated potassium channel
MTFQKRFLYLSLLVVGIFAGGTLGYMYIEGWDALDSFWMVSITLTTVGFGEIHPLSPHGRVFTLVLLFMGMGVIVSGASMVTAFVVEGELNAYLRRRKMKKSLGKMKNHTIVCGAGRTGSHVIDEMKKMKVPFVVVEGHHETAERLRKDGVVVVEGDATHEDSLSEAGIARAGRLVTCLNDDKDNLFVVICARSANPKVRIVARYIDDKSAEKFRKAGADAVVSPNAIGGLRMASVALRPAVVSFLDKMMRSKDGSLRIEQATIHEGSKLVGHTLKDAGIPEKTGVLVTALVRGEEDFEFNPPQSTRLTPGVTILVMGDIKGVTRLKELAGE